MKREMVRTDNAPAAIGTYSQAIRVGGLLFLSGQIGIDPGTGVLVSGGIETETRQVFENLREVARAAGSSLDDAAKLTVYLSDLGDYGKVNELMREYFDAPYPARAAVGIASLPRGARIEVEAILTP